MTKSKTIVKKSKTRSARPVSPAPKKNNPRTRKKGPAAAAALRAELEEVRARLAEAGQTIDAIRNGQVDALVVSKPEGDKVFTLRGAEYAYRVLVEEMNEGAATLSLSGTIFYANCALASLLEGPLEKIVGSCLRQYVPEKAWPAFDDFLARSLQCGAKLELSLKKPGGASIPVLLSGRKLDLDADIRGISVLVTDLTLQKQAENVLRRGRGELENTVRERTAELRIQQFELETQNEELRMAQQQLDASRRKYADLYDFAPVGYFSFDAKGVVTEVNLTGSALLGHQKTALLRKPFFLFIQPEDRRIFEDHKRAVLASGARQTCEVRLLRKQGKVFYAELDSITDLKTGSDTCLSILTAVTDITERKRAEERLKQQEELYRTLAENSPDYIARHDRRYRHIYVNSRIAAFEGREAKDFVGKTLEEIGLPADIAAMWNGTFRRVFETGKEESSELAMPRAGELRHIHRTLVPEFGPDGSVQTVLAIGRDITERKHAENALRRERDRAQQYLDITGTIILALDTTERVSLINQKGCAILGFAEEEILGRNWFDHYIAVEERGKLRDLFIEIVSGRKSPEQQYENEVLTKDGRPRLIAWHNSLVRSEAGEIAGILCSGEDITDRKRAERALQASEERYRNLVSFIPLGMFLVRDGQVRWSNKAAVRLFGARNEQELLGQSPFDHCHLSCHATIKKHLEDLKRGLPVETTEQRIRTLDGKERDVEVTPVSFVSDQGHSILVLLNDITRRKQAEAALQRSEERLRALFEKAGDAIFMLQAEGEFSGRILAANQAAADMHGYSVSELKSMNIADLDSPDAVQDFPGRLARVLSGEWIKCELTHRRKDGTLFPVEVSSGVIVSGDQKFILAFDRDITERKKAEDRIKHQHRLLNAINLIFREALNIGSEEELLKVCLAAAETVTQSSFGFVSEIGSDGLLHNRVLSNPGGNLCGRPSGNFTLQGRFSSAILRGEQFFTNDPASHPDTAGLPEGHPALTAFLGVPLKKAGRTIGMIGLGNRAGGYREEDLESLDALAVATVQVLMRKRTDESLKESENRYRELVQNARSAIIRWKRDGTILFFNDFAQQFFGYDLEQVMGKHISILLPPKALDGEDLTRLAQDVVDRPEDYVNSINENVCRDGRRVWMAWTNKPIFDDRGRVTEILAVGIDITDRKLAEEKIRHLNQDLHRRVAELETIFQTVPIGLAIAEDPEGLRIRGNRAKQEMVGQDRDEFSKKAPGTAGFRIRQGDRELPVAELPMQRAVKGEIVTGQILDLERPDGHIVKLHCSAAPILDEQGRPRGAVGAFLDLTGLIRAEEEIAKLNRELQQNVLTLRASNRELEAFTYSVSHDLRAPLRSIKGFSDFLLEDYRAVLDDRGKSYLDRVVANTLKMDRIIEDLLRLSRISRQQIDRAEVDLSHMVAEHLSELAHGDPERNVLAKVQKNLRARADGALIRLALGNLLNNAWKFTAKTTEPVIEFGKLKIDGASVYFVRDNGAGFDEAFSSKLFQPFHRLHSEQEFEGSGIGLAIVERVIRRHGGRIWAEGRIDQGACFYFTFQ